MTEREPKAFGDVVITPALLGTIIPPDVIQQAHIALFAHQWLCFKDGSKLVRGSDAILAGRYSNESVWLCAVEGCNVMMFVKPVVRG